MELKDLALQVSNDIHKEGKLILLIKFGSHLYGTNTENSDTDYKGIYVPSYKNMIMGTAQDTIHRNTCKGHGQKNTKDDVDLEITSIKKFVALAKCGETMALDVLHANDENILYARYAAEILLGSREKFYTKNLKAFVGYARKQAAKYGLKGSRLDAIKSCMEVVSNGIKSGKSDKLIVYWDMLPVGEHAEFLKPDINTGVQQYQICGKILQSTMSCIYAHDVLSKYYQSYGARAKQAQKSEGVDWKAISHAFRAAYQVKRILTEGHFSFPLPEAVFLKEVKLGNFEYPKVADKLEALIEEVSALSEVSTLPEKVDDDFCNNLVYNITRMVNGNEI